MSAGYLSLHASETYTTEYMHKKDTICPVKLDEVSKYAPPWGMLKQKYAPRTTDSQRITWAVSAADMMIP